MLQTLRARVSANALELARHGVPRQPFYLAGQLDGEPFSVHRAGDRLILTREGQPSREIELAHSATSTDGANVPAEGAPSTPLPTPICPDGSPSAAAGEPAMLPAAAPGQSPLDATPLPDAPSASNDDEQGGER
jgi:hypothetical protein